MISVVIPTYNRAHLLAQTIPSYYQPGVDEIIIVDDASSDNTQEVIKVLSEQYPIKNIRLDKNSKQVIAKNHGISVAKGDWIYFGDDDSILIPGSIERLLCTAKIQKADMVGAKALYMGEDNLDIQAAIGAATVSMSDRRTVGDLRTLRGNFSVNVDAPIEVAYLHASALVKTEWARMLFFDGGFSGNCYREETDFYIRAHLHGARLIYDSRAVQINLPRSVSTGGAHSAKFKWQWYLSAIKNNSYFLEKNWWRLRLKYPQLSSKRNMKVKFFIEMMHKATVSFIVNILNGKK